MSNYKKYLLLFSLATLTFFMVKAQEKESSPLMIQQERIQQLIVKLDEKFLRLSENLKDKEPENAKLLLAAFKKSKESLVQLKVESSIKLLKDQELQKAIDAQQKIIDDLFNILNALTDLDFSNKDEIKRLENLKKKVDKLIKDEYQVKNETSKFEDKKLAAEKYAEEIKKLEALIKESENTLQKTVEDRVKGLSHLSGIAKNIERQSKITEQIYEKIAGYPIDNKDSGKTENPVDQKIIEDPLNKKEAEGDRGAKEPGVMELKKSFDSFGKAEKSIMDGKPFSSEKSQKDAIDSLKNALQELQKEKERIISLPENHPEELAKAQDKITNELEKVKNESEQNKSINPNTDKNSDEKGEEKNGNDGNSPDQKKDGEKDPGENPDGQKGEGGNSEGNKEAEDKSKPNDDKKQNSFDKAKKFMEEASKDLKNKELPVAKDKQSKSIEELKKIKEKIEKTLEQLRNEEKEEKLAGLENRFIEILQRERVVKEQTASLEIVKGKNEWQRSEKLKCANLMHEQNTLRELVIRAEDILVEDASTIVFPDIVLQLKEDMSAVSDLLKSENTGNITQDMENEIILTLEEMVEALQKAREEAKKEAQENKDGNGGGSSMQLISKSQELKLLRKMQIRVNQMTRLYKESSKNANLPESKQDIKKIHDKQKKVLEIARKINERNE